MSDKPRTLNGFRMYIIILRYQRSGDSGVPVLLVHGFGANADHWRKNTPGAALQTSHALDASHNSRAYCNPHNNLPSTHQSQLFIVQRLDSGAEPMQLTSSDTDTQTNHHPRLGSQTQSIILKIGQVRRLHARAMRVESPAAAYLASHAHAGGGQPLTISCKLWPQHKRHRYADQLEAFIDEVIQEPAVVVCNSIGGMPALVLAKQVRPPASFCHEQPLWPRLAGNQLSMPACSTGDTFTK